MNTAGDAAEQMVRFYLEGFEVVAKISGKGAERIVALLLNIIKEQKQTKGKSRLNFMLKSGKPLKVFTIQNKDLSKFAKEAKSYGVLYSALIDRKNKHFDGMVDIMVREEDASKINRIVERFKLITSDPAQVKTEVQKELSNLKKVSEKDKKQKGIQTKSLEDVQKEIIDKKPLQKEEVYEQNFSMAKTDKSPLSEPYSSTSKEGNIEKTRKSVRKELTEIKENMKKQKDLRTKFKEKNSMTPKSIKTKKKEK